VVLIVVVVVVIVVLVLVVAAAIVVLIVPVVTVEDRKGRFAVKQMHHQPSLDRRRHVSSGLRVRPKIQTPARLVDQYRTSLSCVADNL
jgi:predicted Holliday junction resolvase-like endonuclease